MSKWKNLLLGAAIVGVTSCGGQTERKSFHYEATLLDGSVRILNYPYCNGKSNGTNSIFVTCFSQDMNRAGWQNEVETFVAKGLKLVIEE